MTPYHSSLEQLKQHHSLQLHLWLYTLSKMPSRWQALTRTYTHRHTCTHIQVHTHIYSQTCTCIQMQAHTCIDTCIHTCNAMYMHTCIHMQTCTYTNVYTPAQTHSYTYTHMQEHTHIHTHTQALFPPTGSGNVFLRVTGSFILVSSVYGVYTYSSELLERPKNVTVMGRLWEIKK